MVPLSMEMVQQVLLEQGLHGHTHLHALNLIFLRNEIINDDDRVNLTHACEEFVRALIAARCGLLEETLQGTLSETDLDAPAARAVPPLELLLNTTTVIPLQLAAFVPPAATLLQTAAIPPESPLRTAPSPATVAGAIADNEAHDTAIDRLISANTTAHADQFISDAVGRLRALPFSEFLVWPEYPGVSLLDLRIPVSLSQYTFTLTKDTLPGGELRISLQRRPRSARPGPRSIAVDGFVVAMDGTSRALTQQEVWYLS